MNWKLIGYFGFNLISFAMLIIAFVHAYALKFDRATFDLGLSILAYLYTKD